MIKRIKSAGALVLGITLFIVLALWYIFIITPWTLLALMFNMKKIYPKIQTPSYKIFFKMFGIKRKISGKEHLKGVTEFIVLSNHQSFLDIPIVVDAVGPVAFLAKEELFSIPLFGWAIRNGGSLEVYRKDPQKNHNLPQRMKHNIDEGHNFCAFPEGTRSNDRTIGTFKGGIFKYIKDIGHPIVPITIKNANEVMHKKSIRLYPGTIEIQIHPPISYETIKNTEVADLREMTRAIIISGMN